MHKIEDLLFQIFFSLETNKQINMQREESTSRGKVYEFVQHFWPFCLCSDFSSFMRLPVVILVVSSSIKMAYFFSSCDLSI